MVRAHSADQSRINVRTGLSLMCALVGAVVWLYWPLLVRLESTWSGNREYSHGYLVPVFAAYVLWVRRHHLQGAFAAPFSRSALIAGVGLILCGGAVRALAIYVRMMPVEAGSLLFSLGGVVLLCGGWPAARWAAPAVAYLVFMIPLPQALAGSMSSLLQGIATNASTFALQTFGVPAVAYGNVIVLTDATIGVAEACNGLSMLYAFFALSMGICLLVDRPLWQKCVVAVSAVVIAMVSNIVRITVTGMAFEYGNPELAQRIFHDLAGWLMMPIGVGCLVLELAFLSRVVHHEPTDGIHAIAMNAN